VSEDVAMGKQIWVLGLIVTMLLMIGEAELNPGLKADQEKINQIIVYFWNQEEMKDIKSLLETHIKELKEINDAYPDLGTKSDKLTEVISDVSK
jgi:hypothetical protein